VNRGTTAFPALALAFTLVMLAVGYFHYHYSWTAFAFPLAAGVALCLLCAFEIATLLRRRGGSAPGPDAPPPVSLAGMAWLFALAGFLYAFGFIVGAALYLLVCLRGNGFAWRLSLGTAVASLLIGWGLFVKLLGVQLPVTPLWMG
jgi:Tripartite tricarboxylate transporter TctB family